MDFLPIYGLGRLAASLIDVRVEAGVLLSLAILALVLLGGDARKIVVVKGFLQTRGEGVVLAVELLGNVSGVEPRVCVAFV